VNPLVRVALPVPLARCFDYRLPDGSKVPSPGCRVLAPFGSRRLVGMVIDVVAATATPSSRLKTLVRVLDEAPVATPEWWTTLHWAARYYQHPLGAVLEAALPVALRSPRPLPDPVLPAYALSTEGRAALEQPGRRRGTRIDALLSLLADGALTHDTLDARLPGWRTPARTLATRGWIEPCRAPAMASTAVAPPPLNPAQRAAFHAIDASRDEFGAFLIDGVTGSGKTEVYLALIAECLARGRQALVLVPEILLTPQMLHRFRERLGIEIAALHSGLGDTERARAWLAAARGEARVVLGTRSAVFVPLAAPGLIVVDEEHDTSYKQHEGFRYHARDLAVVRAKSLDIPVVLGSATPSLETLANVGAGRYRSLRLRERAGAAQPPAIEVIDLRRRRLQHGFAQPTLSALDACLARGETALVFKNRRGYAPALLCHDCGWSAQCPACERPLTWHRGAARLRCHHCGREERLPQACPECDSFALNPQGEGTERLELALQLRYPAVPIVRVDRDTTRSRGRRDALIDGLAAEGARILVGTQMLAKGHDLPNLTLVIVVGVDEGLFSVDFRAAERLGQLVVQVAGRAGRAQHPGTVVLQTHHPDHPLLRTLLTEGYGALAATLLEERRRAHLPPYGHLALVRAESKHAAPLEEFLARAADAVHGAGITAHGPMPAPLPKRGGFHRAQLLIEGDERGALQAFLPDWVDTLRAITQRRRVRWSLDVDPVELY
jgi:primosomal protein N' (replication factor Y)